MNDKEYFNEITPEGKRLEPTGKYKVGPVSLDNEKLPDDLKPVEKSPEELLIEIESYNNLADYLNNTLSVHQKKILRFLEQGLSQNQIAQNLSISRSSVRDSIDLIRKKTQSYLDSVEN